MPRQRIHHTRETYDFPDDFPERLVRFQEESQLPWAEINRRLDTHPETTRRWKDQWAALAACPWRPALLLKPRALSRGRTAYRPEVTPSACWLWRMALPSTVVSASPFVGLPVDGGLTAPAHAGALDRQTFSQR